MKDSCDTPEDTPMKPLNDAASSVSIRVNPRYPRECSPHSRTRTQTFLFRLLLACLFAALLQPARADEPRRFEFTTLVAHWAEYADPEYLPFIEEARPDVAQIGFYGAHFWSLAHTPHGKGYPAHFPVQGHKECREWFASINRELHRRNVKVVGHMNVKFLVGDPDSPEGPRGFFQFYRDWDEAQLGPKPVADPLTLLEKKVDGSPITNNNYSIGGMKEYWACLNNPHWRQVLKAWAKHAIAQGVDGLVINYFYRNDCHCEHCVAGFKKYLADRFTADELRTRFEIADLPAHRFAEIVAWHDPKESTPLRREMLRFSQIANKEAFDEVFVQYGRSLKPDLILAQWNHLGAFNQINGDERCLLPAELWGKGEDYLWYSTGGAAYYTDLAEGFLGEGTLQARYIRGAFDDKPFTLGKYESTRTRVSIAELAANGGAPMGFYTRFRDPEARREIARYYSFMKRYDKLFRANRPASELLLLYPRSRVHQGDLEPVTAFKEIGRRLLDRHVLFDVMPDDIVSAEQRSRFPQVVDPVMIARSGSSNEAYATVLAGLPSSLSRFQAPTTVRVSASHPTEGNEWTLHFVNYNRQEPEQKHSAGRGIVDEKPVAVKEIAADMQLPPGKRAAKVVALTPESPEPMELPFEQSDARLKFTVPEFLVYSVVRIEWETE
jgi:hypothetical protein